MIDHIKLKTLLLEKDKEQQELAAYLDMHQSYVSKLCNNDVNVTSSTLKGICNFLECEPRELWK